jgi:hypothetical protein
VSDTQVDPNQDLAPAEPVEATPEGSAPTPDQAPEPPVEYDYLDIDDELASKYVKLPVDGEEVSVPLKEALQGYQRQADYTRKTQEASEMRKQAEQALQLQRALQANPGMTMQILAEQAGMSVEDFLGLTPRQQQAALDNATDNEDQYVDPLERQLAEERRAREALEERFRQREADEVVNRAVSGLKQQFGISDDEVRQVVSVAFEMGLPPQMLPMVYQSMAYQKMQTQNGVRQEAAAQQATQDQQRQAAAAAAQQVVSQGTGATGVTNKPASQEFTNYRDAILAAFEQHGDVSG